jgi:hypothetical protein
MKTNLISRFRKLIFTIFALTAISFVGSFSRDARAQQPSYVGGAGITIFEDIDFAGAARSFSDDVPDLTKIGWNDRISSFRVGRGEQWELCEDIYYRGQCIVVSGSERDMRVNNWNDMVSSFRRVRGDRGPASYPGTGGAGSIVLYHQPNFRGASTNYNGVMNDINDNVRSVNVGFGTWQLCEGRNFTGRCATVTQNTGNLSSDLNIGPVIRSLRPMGIVPPGGPRNFPGERNREAIILYDQTNYRGNPSSYSNVQTNIGDNARSITVERGTWQVCDGANFTGRCVTVSQSVPDLRTLALGRTIRSVRPAGFVPPGYPGPTNYPGSGSRNWFVVLYDQENFRGTSATFRGENPNIDQRTRSVTVSQGVWDVCSGPNFTGRCQTLNINVPKFSIYNIGDRIRSLRPQSPQ